MKRKAIVLDINESNRLIDSKKLKRNVTNKKREFLTELQEHQKNNVLFAIERENKGLGGCVFDEQGMGKTATFLNIIHRQYGVFKEKGYNGKTLVVLPRSGMSVWKNEIDKHMKGYNVYEYVKNGIVCYNHDIVLITYTRLKNEYKLKVNNKFKKNNIFDRRWSRVILDESHNICNKKTYRCTATLALKNRSYIRWVSTGTPMQNRPNDLWTSFLFIDPPQLISWQEWRSKSDMELFIYTKELINQISVRTLCKDTLPKLHEFIWSKQFQNKEEEELYMKYRSEIQEEVIKYDKTEKSERLKQYRNILQVLIKLRQVCSCACAVDDSLYNKRWATTESTKMSMLQEYLDNRMQKDDNLLIFCEFITTMTQIEEILKKRKIGYIHISGKNNNQSGELVNKFNNNKRIRVCVLSIRATNSALNLQKANRVIIWDPNYNPQIVNQAIKRAHRIGQNREVFVTYFLICNTVEERISNRSEKKNIIATALLDTIDCDEQIENSLLDMKQKIISKSTKTGIQQIRNFIEKTEKTEQVDEEVMYNKHKKLIESMIEEVKKDAIPPTIHTIDTFQNALIIERNDMNLKQLIHQTGFLPNQTPIYTYDWKCDYMEFDIPIKMFLTKAEAFLAATIDIPLYYDEYLHTLSKLKTEYEQELAELEIQSSFDGVFLSEKKKIKIDERCKELNVHIKQIKRQLCDDKEMFIDRIESALLCSYTIKDITLKDIYASVDPDMYLDYNGYAISTNMVHFPPDQQNIDNSLLSYWIKHNQMLDANIDNLSKISIMKQESLLHQLSFLEHEYIQSYMIQWKNTEILLQINTQNNMVYLSQTENRDLSEFKELLKQKGYVCTTN